MLMEAILDLFSIQLLAHLHDTAVSRYIVRFLSLAAAVTKESLCLSTPFRGGSDHRPLFPLPTLHATSHFLVSESRSNVTHSALTTQASSVLRAHLVPQRASMPRA